MAEWQRMSLRGSRRRGSPAWVISWEGRGIGSDKSKSVAAILPSRTSAKRILEIALLLYTNDQYSPAERLRYHRQPKKHLPPVQYGALYGTRFEGRMVVGFNPYLRARLVNDLHIEINSEGEERFSWTERSLPFDPLIAKALGYNGTT